jgi:hypothetical protein
MCMGLGWENNSHSILDVIDLGRGPQKRSGKRCVNVMKDWVVLHAMAHICHPKLASGVLVTLLQEACDIFNFKSGKK